jgi:hypothetical protein
VLLAGAASLYGFLNNIVARERRMIIRVFTGQNWSAATVVDDAEFEVLPRKGEKLAIARNGQWAVAVVTDIAHRATGHGAADVALLVGPVVESPRGDEVLPLTALDGNVEAQAASVPRVARPGPWSA